MNYKTAVNQLAELKRLAKPYYASTGGNSWEHINQVMDNASAMVNAVDHRPLTLEEQAAILFHDASVKPTGTRKHHGNNSADLAIPILLSTGYFSKPQLDTIRQAIIEHETLDNKGGPFSSDVGDVLASGDAVQPDLPWIANKAWAWGIKHGIPKEQRNQHAFDSLREFWSSKSTAKYPRHYNEFHGSRVDDVKKQVDNMTVDQFARIVAAYRKRHRLNDEDPRLPASTAFDKAP